MSALLSSSHNPSGFLPHGPEQIANDSETASAHVTNDIHGQTAACMLPADLYHRRTDIANVDLVAFIAIRARLVADVYQLDSMIRDLGNEMINNGITAADQPAVVAASTATTAADGPTVAADISTATTTGAADAAQAPMQTAANTTAAAVAAPSTAPAVTAASAPPHITGYNSHPRG